MNNIIINNIEFYMCPNCDYLKKKYKLTSSEEKNRYDQHICDGGYYTYMNNIFNLIRPFLNEGLCLDYGCGKIHLLSDILNNNGYVSNYYDLYYYPEFNKGLYDNIILIEVFEHIDNIYDLLVELKKYLKVTGKILIMTKPIPQNLNNWWYLRDTTHISFVNLKTMKYLSDLLNMKVEYIEGSSLFVFTCIK